MGEGNNFLEKREVPRDSLPLDEHARRALRRFEVKPDGTQEDVRTAVFAEGEIFRDLLLKAAVDDVANRRLALRQSASNLLNDSVTEEDKRFLAGVVEQQYSSATSVLTDGGLFESKDALPSLQELYAYVLANINPAQVEYLRKTPYLEMLVVPNISSHAIIDNLKNGTRFPELFQQNPFVSASWKPVRHDPREDQGMVSSLDFEEGVSDELRGFHLFFANPAMVDLNLAFGNGLESALHQFLRKNSELKLRGLNVGEFVLYLHKTLLTKKDNFGRFETIFHNPRNGQPHHYDKWNGNHGSHIAGAYLDRSGNGQSFIQPMSYDGRHQIGGKLLTGISV